MPDYERTVIINAGDESDEQTERLLVEAADALRKGELVAFPTETVYGLGANAFLDEAVAEVYRVKGRPQDNPLIVHLADFEDLEKVALNVDDRAIKLFRKFSPGPLTLVLRRHPDIPPRVSAGRDTVAVRFPEHSLTQKLLRLAKIPVVAPSANLSGKSSPTRAWHVQKDMEYKIPYIIDGGSCKVGLESTVLDLSGDLPTILRPGAITAEMIEAELGVPVRDSFSPDSDGKAPKAPGMKYKHYSPRAKVYILPVNPSEQAEVWETMKRFKGKVGLFINAELTDDMKSRLQCVQQCQTNVLIEFYENGAEGASAGLFDFFRRMDEENAIAVFIQAEEERGKGTAYMNRLKKAAIDENFP